MKKLVLLVLMIMSVMLLGACVPNDTTELEERIIALEEEVIILEEDIVAVNERIDNLVITTGLNWQTDIYENEENTQEDEPVVMSLSNFQQLVSEDEIIDWSQFPDYIRDVNGDYVTIDDLGKLLVAKYFGTTATATTGIQFRIAFNLTNNEMTNEEFIARLSMLVIELSEYDYYTIDAPQLYFLIQFNGQTIEFKSRMSLLINDKYNIVPGVFFEELLDVDISGIVYNSTTVKTLCDEFILNEIFIGYVLDYK